MRAELDDDDDDVVMYKCPGCSRCGLFDIADILSGEINYCPDCQETQEPAAAPRLH